jgi:predicted nucleic acid-binding protein
MNIFIDTAAFLAVLNAVDRFHESARHTWDEILSSDSALFSSNYVILETIALLQHRFGIEAVRLFESDILPVVEIAWVDESIHKQGVSALLAANRRNLSLVDCTSFEIMRQIGLDTAFTYDLHFHEQGFKAIPEGSAL